MRPKTLKMHFIPSEQEKERMHESRILYVGLILQFLNFNE